MGMNRKNVAMQPLWVLHFVAKFQLPLLSAVRWLRERFK